MQAWTTSNSLPKRNAAWNCSFRQVRYKLFETILLEQCGTNIPSWEVAGLERLRFAVLKRSDGDLAELQRAVDLAKLDYRDALMGAGLGDPYAYTRWLPSRKW
jgi:hypothetical protein